jgi:hypothetical protein
MPIMSQMTANGSTPAASSTKSPLRRAARSSTMDVTVRRMSSAAFSTTRGVNARDTTPRSRACRGSSRFTIESPKTTRTQRGGRGVVTPGPLMNTSGVRLAATTSACRTSAWNPRPARSR